MIVQPNGWPKRADDTMESKESSIKCEQNDFSYLSCGRRPMPREHSPKIYTSKANSNPSSNNSTLSAVAGAQDVFL
jgi:hypothetical protein